MATSAAPCKVTESAFKVLEGCRGCKFRFNAFKSSNFTSRTRLHQSLCKFRLNAHQKWQLCKLRHAFSLYLRSWLQSAWRCVTLPRVRALDHAISDFVVTLPRVRAFRHANPCEELQSAFGNVSLYLALWRAFDHANPCKVRMGMSLYFTFVRSTTRVPVKGCIPDGDGATRVQKKDYEIELFGFRALALQPR